MGLNWNRSNTQVHDERPSNHLTPRDHSSDHRSPSLIRDCPTRPPIQGLALLRRHRSSRPYLLQLLESRTHLHQHPRLLILSQKLLLRGRPELERRLQAPGPSTEDLNGPVGERSAQLRRNRYINIVDGSGVSKIFFVMSGY